jgi:hypothetical protein
VRVGQVQVIAINDKIEFGGAEVARLTVMSIEAKFAQQGERRTASFGVAGLRVLGRTPKETLPLITSEDSRALVHVKYEEADNNRTISATLGDLDVHLRRDPLAGLATLGMQLAGAASSSSAPQLPSRASVQLQPSSLSPALSTTVTTLRADSGALRVHLWPADTAYGSTALAIAAVGRLRSEVTLAPSVGLSVSAALGLLRLDGREGAVLLAAEEGEAVTFSFEAPEDVEKERTVRASLGPLRLTVRPPAQLQDEADLGGLALLKPLMGSSSR